jgi:predicted esterase
VASRRAQLRELYGEFSPTDPFWRQIVPTNYLEGVSGAVQINHAVNDEVVSIEYSRNLMKLLADSQIVHELKEYSSGGHNLTGTVFGQAMAATVEFYKNHLP